MASNHRHGKKKRPVRIVIADDHILLRELLVKFLSENFDRLRVIGEVASIDAAIRVCLDLKPDLLLPRVLLMGPSNEAAIARLRQRLPKINIFLYSGAAAKDSDIIYALRGSVDSHIGKAATLLEFLDALDRTLKGKSYFCGDSSRLLAEVVAGRRHNQRSKT